MIRRLCIAALSAAGLTWLIAAPVAAQSFPDRPIKIVAPQPPGGNIDTTARAVAQALSEALGVSVVVENRTGAGGTIGTTFVAKSAPDGYTLLFAGSGQLAVAPAVYQAPGYDTTKDLAVVGPVQQVPLVLTAGPKSKAGSFAELVKLAQQQPGAISIASAGTGSSNHLTLELMAQQAGIKLLHAPYRGSGPALNDLLGGQVDLMMDQLNSSLPHLKSGKVRALAVTSRSRSPSLPDVPTLHELGLSGFDVWTYSALMAPAGTPKPVLDKLSAALKKGLESSSMRERFAAMGVEAMSASPANFETELRADVERWKKLAREANITAE